MQLIFAIINHCVAPTLYNNQHKLQKIMKHLAHELLKDYYHNALKTHPARAQYPSVGTSEVFRTYVTCTLLTEPANPIFNLRLYF